MSDRKSLKALAAAVLHSPIPSHSREAPAQIPVPSPLSVESVPAPDRLAAPQPAGDLRAKELIKVCREHGVGLKFDPDGTLVVVSNGNAWRSLVNEIELHIDAIADLLAAGWDGTDT
jgi:hypothetical protein